MGAKRARVERDTAKLECRGTVGPQKPEEIVKPRKYGLIRPSSPAPDAIACTTALTVVSAIGECPVTGRREEVALDERWIARISGCCLA